MKLKKTVLLFLFLIIPFIKPAEYVFGSFFDNIMDVWKLFSSATALIMYISRSKLSPIILFTVLFQVSLTIPTLLQHNSELRTQIIFMLSNIAFSIIVELGVKYYCDDFLKAVSIYGGSMCFIMAVTMFIYYPSGMDQKEFMDILGDNNFYFLGHDNGSFFIIFAVQIYSIAAELRKYDKLSSGHIILWLFIDSAFFYVRSVAAMIASLFLWYYLIFIIRKNYSSLLNFRNYSISITILFWGVVILRIHNYFGFFIEDILHKNMTLSGRTIIWDIALAYIKKSPIIGYGREDMGIMMQKFGINHVHNIFLEIMYQGGIIGIIIYICILFLCGKKLMQYRGNKINDIVSFSLFVYLMISIADYYNSKYFIYGIIILAYNIPYLIKDKTDTPTDITEVSA